MFRDRDEELNRLQEKLLEEEESQQEPEDTDDITFPEDEPEEEETEVYQNFSNDYGKSLRNYASGYNAYNADRTDIDLESFSQQVREPKKSGCSPLLVVFFLLTAAVTTLAFLLYMKSRGIL